MATRIRNSIQHFMAATDSSGKDQTDQLFTLLEETAMAETTIERRISVLVYSDMESAYDYLVTVFQLGPGALFRDETGRPVHGELEAGDGVVWLHPELERAR
ncbi:MAG TPA: hypothetical protein VKT20_04185, partial [Candidatus Dormibacteraeota bacterium]|nr:hypothetical protein [Candidatus Dormibacteraeota bacterium]